MSSTSNTLPPLTQPAQHLVGVEAPSAVVDRSPVAPPALPLRAGHLSIADLVDLYMAHYEGRDASRDQITAWWVRRIGAIALQDLTDDHVHAGLDELASAPPRYFAGKDAEGRPIYRAKKKPVAPATINRYAAGLAAVITWAIKRRIAPKGYVHPCRSIERRTENNAKTRFLSDDERERLLQACRASSWPRLYVLVLMALTTGARKGELLGLHWRDVDLERGEATVGRTKNGDPRLLPLVPAVVAELEKLKAGPGARVFPGRLDPRKAFAFEPRFREALKVARVRDFRFHDLRHSCASHLARSGATLLEIADLLGHRQLQMTKRYSHLATSHKRELVNRVMGQFR